MDRTQEKNYKFGKEERLHHRSLVERLFREGTSFYEFPLRVTYNQLSPQQLTDNFRDHVPEGISGLQMMITVPKKKRKRAVDRVLLRRRIREAYRLNRLQLKETVEKKKDEIATFSVSFIYIHDQNLPYSSIEFKMKKVLKKLEQIINKEKKD